MGICWDCSDPCRIPLPGILSCERGRLGPRTRAVGSTRRLRASLGSGKSPTLVLGATACCHIPPWDQVRRLHTAQLFSCLQRHTRLSSKVDYWPAALTPMVRSRCRMECFPIRLQVGRDRPPVRHALDLCTQLLVAIHWTRLLPLALFWLFRGSL